MHSSTEPTATPTVEEFAGHAMHDVSWLYVSSGHCHGASTFARQTNPGGQLAGSLQFAGQ